MPRKRKLNAKSTDRADQRRRAEAYKKDSSELAPLSSRVPAYMKGTPAGDAWRSIVPILRKSQTIRQADVKTVEALCTSYMIYRDAFESIQKDGIQQKIYKTMQNAMGEKIGTDFVGFKKNPAVTTMDSAINRIRQLSSDLGLTPTARASLLSLPTNKDDKDAPSLADLMSQKVGF